jgi:hypothetical protein
MKVISNRFEKYGLSLHPDKTRLLDFRSPSHRERRRKDDGDGGGKPQTFDLLGFTHYWGKTRKGNWAVKRKTMPCKINMARLARSLQKIEQWCRNNRHRPILEQWKELCMKLRGHYCYYGITGNSRSLGLFFYRVCRIWQRWLSRRTNRRSFIWEKFNSFLKRCPLPIPQVVHSVFRK